MPIMPFTIVWIWLRGLISVGIIVGGIALLRGWYDDTHKWVVDPGPTVTISTADQPKSDVIVTNGPAPKTAHWEINWDIGLNKETAKLAAGMLLLTMAVAGRPIIKGVLSLRLKHGRHDPSRDRRGEFQTIRRPDGSEIHVELYGPPDAPPIVFTHGWGADATEWYYEKRDLADNFRLILWDLPGLGLSKGPDNRDYSLEKYARDLDAVVALAGGRPVLLVGHSIGGMITLVYSRLFAEALGTKVAGLALVHTTYTDPIRTMKGAEIKTKLEGPLVTPLLHMTIALWPVVWAMDWLAYFNGSVHQQTHSGAFSGGETRGQLDFAASFLPYDRPDVLARGMFGMMHFDETATLRTIRVPTLVIPADLDDTCLPSASQTMAHEIPGATLTALSPAKHMGLVEHHDRFDHLIAEFAQACQGVASRVV